MDPTIEHFVEKMGRHFEADGGARIGGRLFGYLLLQDEPRSLDELAEDLKVSKASISTNARLLEQWGIVERVSRPGDRRDFYIAAADQTRMLELRLARLKEMNDLIREGCETVPHDRPLARKRLNRIRTLSEEALDCFTELLDRWNHEREGNGWEK